jgi:hypothetical protein
VSELIQCIEYRQRRSLRWDQFRRILESAVATDDPAKHRLQVTERVLARNRAVAVKI